MHSTTRLSLNLLLNEYFVLHEQILVVPTFFYSYSTSNDNLATGFTSIAHINLFWKEIWRVLVLWDIHCCCIETGSLSQVC